MGVPRRGDIYQVDWRPARGHEQTGTRPALIVQNDVGNRFAPTTIVAAITSRPPKRDYPFEVPVPEGVLPKASWVNCSHLYTIDQGRLGRLMGTLPPERLTVLDAALGVAFGIALPRR